MNHLEALLLGLLQGLTEFLPVSSSGHIELGKALFRIQPSDNLAFTIIVHGATVLSTIVVFRKDIFEITRETLRFEWNDSTKYVSFILASMIPVGVVGLLFEQDIEQFFEGRIVWVGAMLCLTGTLLLSTHFIKPGKRSVSYGSAFLIGIAQALAVLPGISRSGSTIVTALILNIEQSKATRFSFLMVLLPIIGITLLKVKDLLDTPGISAEAGPLAVGFLAAFVAGYFACKWMLTLVRQMKLFYFAFYCYLVGIIAILSATL